MHTHTVHQKMTVTINTTNLLKAASYAENKTKQKKNLED